MKTKKLFLELLIALIVLVCDFANLFSQELIADKDFQRGFFIRDTIPPYSYFGPIRGDNSLAAPVWNTAEWHSKSSLRSIPKDTMASGFYKWADSNKDFRFGPVGAEEYQLYFGVNSQNEYNNVYRSPSQEWPHLFVEQRLCPPYDFPGQGPGCPPLSDMDSLVFKIDAKLLYNQTIKNAGYDPNYHAAQFLVYFYVQNTNPSSSGLGKYVWLGVPLYDDRTPILPGQISYDVATATLINSIPYTDFASTSLHNGTWVHAQLDLLPYALAALDTAWANGFLNESTNVSDYKISGIVIGWELPGMNICTVGIKGLSLFAYQTPTGVIPKGSDQVNPLTIYPNPGSGLYMVQYVLKGEANAGLVEKRRVLDVYNVFGERVYSVPLQNGKGEAIIDLGGMNNGVYFVKTNDPRSLMQKLVLQK